MVEVAYVGSRGRDMLVKTNPNQAPPVLGVTQRRREPAVHPASRPPCATSGTCSSTGFLNYDAPARQVPAAVRQRVLVPELLHLRPGHRPQLRQRRRRDPDQHLRPGLQPRARRLRRQAHVRVELSSTSCPSPRRTSSLGGWQVSGILYARTGRALTITQTQGVLSTGSNTGQQGANRPNRLQRRTSTTPTRRSTTGSTRRPSRSCRRRRRPTATPAATSRAARATSTSTRTLIKITQVREVRARAARRGLQHPQPPGLRRPQHDVRHRGLRHDHGHAGQPVLRAVRHDGAADPALGEAPVLVD